jgi:hypothetical protein
MGGGRRASMANSEFSAPPDSGEEMLDPFDEVPVEISFSCEGLPLLEMTGSCMSVFAVVWLYNRTDRRWQEHGRTEVVRHGDSPAFARSFYLRYAQNNNPVTYEATDQWVRVQIFQRNSYVAPHRTAPQHTTTSVPVSSRCTRRPGSALLPMALCQRHVHWAIQY